MGLVGFWEFFLGNKVFGVFIDCCEWSGMNFMLEWLYEVFFLRGAYTGSMSSGYRASRHFGTIEGVPIFDSTRYRALVYKQYFIELATSFDWPDFSSHQANRLEFIRLSIFFLRCAENLIIDRFVTFDIRETPRKKSQSRNVFRNTF